MSSRSLVGAESIRLPGQGWEMPGDLEMESWEDSGLSGV